MKNKLSILVILSFGLIGCSSPKSSFELSESSSLRQVFSAEEINELKIAFDFFNGELCAEQQINKDCYRTFFQMLNKNNAEGFVELPISYAVISYLSHNSIIFFNLLSLLKMLIIKYLDVFV